MEPLGRGNPHKRALVLSGQRMAEGVSRIGRAARRQGADY